MGGTGYLFSNEDPEAGNRFDALAALFDRWTIDHLARLGVAPGARCLEVGAGGGSIAAWLAKRVGSTGHVLATDLDVRWLEAHLQVPGLEVRHHDVVSDPLPERAFDLIHERLVLVHIPARDAVLRRLIGALKPGGWLVCETFDVSLSTNVWRAPDADPDDVGSRVARGVQQLLRQRGADAELGHRLPGLMRSAGLVDVGADAYQVIDGGAGPRRLLRANVIQSMDGLIASGFELEELEGFVAQLDAGQLDPATPLLVSVWGRRPPETS